MSAPRLAFLALILWAAPQIAFADPVSGERVFQRCYSCHSVIAGEDKLPGPNLKTVLGRRAGTLPGYEYSPAMIEAGTRNVVWTRDALEKYLAESKKTREELLKSWEEAADKRARVRLILADIARKESIDPDPAVIDHELSHAREHYPDADQQALRAHITHGMRNEMTLRFLEGNTEPVGHTDHDH